MCADAQQATRKKATEESHSLPQPTPTPDQTPRRDELQRILIVCDLLEHALRTMPGDDASQVVQQYQDELSQLEDVNGLREPSDWVLANRYEGRDAKGKSVFTLEPYTDPETGEYVGVPVVPWRLVQIDRLRQRTKSAVAKISSPDAAVRGDKSEPEPVTTTTELNETEKCIVEALREEGRRLTTDPLLKKALGKVNSHGKGVLTSLVKRGVIDNKRDAKPPGYGLPEWSDGGQDHGQD